MARGEDFGGTTHLARVDLLAAESIVVGTHVGGVDAVPVVSRFGSLSKALNLTFVVPSLCVSGKLFRESWRAWVRVASATCATVPQNQHSTRDIEKHTGIPLYS